MKKWFGYLGCLLLLVTLFAAWSLAADVTTIQYSFWGNPTAIGVEKDIIDEFEKIHPDIKVTPIAVDYNNYHTKLLTLIAGGQAPDVMRIDSYFFTDFMKAKAVKDITALIKKDKVNLKAYYQAGLFDCRQGNKYYGLPWGTAPLYIFINTKMFKDAGIPVPSVDWKYDDFLKIARQLSKGQGADRQYGFALLPVELNHFLSFIWGNGGDLFDKSRKKFTLNKPESVKRLQEIADLIKEGVIPDPAQFTSADVINRWMVNYKAAIRMGSAAEILSMQALPGFDFDVLPFPGTPLHRNVTIYKSNVIGISSTTKKDKAAWEFLKFLRAPGQRGETLYMQAKRMPPCVDDPELWKIYADPNKSPHNVAEVSKIVASKYGHALPLRSGWMEIQGLVIPQLQRVYAGQISAKQAMDEIAPKVQEVINRTN